MLKNIPLLNREISWLYFNDRVLQEAADPSVPLIERIHFLAIFSSNLEEFYRIRVATLNRLAKLNDQSSELLGYNPKEILNQIKVNVINQEHKFKHLFETIIIKELAAHKIFIINETQLNASQGQFVKDFFREKVLSTLVPIMIHKEDKLPELKDQSIYFLIKLTKAKDKKAFKYALIEIPTDHLSRFIVLPSSNQLKYILLLDDIIRYCLDEIFFIFDYDKIDAYSIQLTRDAEFDLDHNVSDKFIEALSKGLQKRRNGEPMRLLYDVDMPTDMLTYLVSSLNLRADGLILGARYHNFKDFIQFPNIGTPALEYAKVHPVPVKNLSTDKSIFPQIAAKDYLISTPYQSFDYVIRFLREAAINPKVKEIRITLYRLAAGSNVINALINASKNGKKVHCLVELQARFDEQANINWAKQLEEGGVIVHYGMPDHKVHSKTCLVTRIEKGKQVHYAYLATGNFNEKTAELYCDHSLFTANPLITTELVNFFKGLQKKMPHKRYKQLIVSPHGSRQKFNQLIKKEIKLAKSGKDAYVILKMNSLSDENIIAKLYEASNAGVKIRLIIRGMCCLIPGIKNFSENIEVISIIDKYLEHARVWIFSNGGNELIYLSSADLMTRNLDHRVEIGFPILDQDIKKEIRGIIDIQLKDNTKAREINQLNDNRYVQSRSKKTHRAQKDIYTYLGKLK